MTNNFYTTFAELREQQACQKRYKYLAKKLGGIKKYGRYTPIKYSRCLEIMGIADTLWALQKKGSDVSEYVLQLFMVGVAYNVLRFFEVKHPNDGRIRKVIKIRHLYAYGEATKEDFEIALDAAGAVWAAQTAAWDAVWDAVWDAWNAARDAARAARAARAAGAARDNERKFQTALLMEILRDVEGEQ